MSEGAARDWQRYWAAGLAAVVLVIAGAVTLRHAALPLLEWGMFRQTQTALTSYWMLKEGLQMPYQTPVLGYPWAVPFEFPIFQLLVAGIVAAAGAPIDATGRLVSFAFLIACVWPALQIARRLELPRSAVWLFCALLWSSPIYLFWGGTFMVETAALFFSFAALPYGLDLGRPVPTWRSAALFALFAGLALLQKLTTAAPMMIVAGLLIALARLRHRGLRLPPLRSVLVVGAAFLVPLSIGYGWTRYADHIRSKNLYGQTTTFKAQSQYYIGTLADRFDPALLKTIFWERVTEPNIAGLLGLAILVLALVFAENRVRAVIAVCLLLFALPILMFLQVHFFLAYYQSASVLFLLAALAVALACGLSRIPGGAVAAPILAIVVVAANFYHFTTGYGAYLEKPIDASNNGVLAVSDVIRRYTPADSAILVFALLSRDSAYPVVSYSSEIAYYSQRKAFTVEDSFEEKVWGDPASYLGGKALGAIAICDGHELERYAPVIRHYDKGPQPFVFDVLNCHVWLPGADRVTLADGSEAKRRPL